MSKKTSNRNFIGGLSLVGIIISAICLILAKLGLGGGLFSLIGTLCLLAACVIASWDYVKGYAKWVQVTYYVSVILIIVFAVLGIF